MKNFLTTRGIEILEEAHHSCRLRKSADRIKTILLLDEGYSYETIAHILRLDDVTIRRYFKEFKTEGIDGLLEDHYHGSTGFLTTEQERQLTTHLKSAIFQTVKAVVSHAKKTYGQEYSVEGMTHLLHRLGFVYKKTKAIPGKVDLDKQEQFKKEYADLKQNKKPEDKIYFADASHPHHNNRPFYAWIYKGEEKAIKTNSGRKRINLNGAVNIEDMEITVLNEDAITTHAMMRLVLALEEKQPEGAIYVILDN